MIKIKYKVVGKGRRSCGVTTAPHELKGLSKLYSKGNIVKANLGTMGIYVFREERDAEDFARTYWWGSLRILRVKPIGKKTKKALMLDTHTLAHNLHSDLGKLYGKHKENFTKILLPFFTQPPKGTECYPAVEVLD